MAVAGGIIYANDYNTYKDRLVAILETYYGQSIASTTVVGRTLDTLLAYTGNSHFRSDNTIGSTTAHGLTTGDTVLYDANGNTPISGLNDQSTYFVQVINTTRFYLCTDAAATNIIDIEPGTGTHNIVYYEFDVVEALHIENLVADISRCYLHQNGEAATQTTLTALDAIGAGYIIGADRGFDANNPADYTLDTDGSVLSATWNNLQGIDDFDTILDLIEADKNQVNDDQLSDNLAPLTSERTDQWGDIEAGEPNTVSARVRFTWTSEAEANYFFRCGGVIELDFTADGRVDTASGSKDTNWRNIMTNADQLSFRLNVDNLLSSTDGSGSLDSDFGWDTLTAGAIGGGNGTSKFIKSGTGDYTDNKIEVFAKRSANELRFDYVLTDADSGDTVTTPAVGVYDFVDETVNTNLYVTVNIYYPTGQSFSVQQPTITEDVSFQ